MLALLVPNSTFDKNYKNFFKLGKEKKTWANCSLRGRTFRQILFCPNLKKTGLF